MLHFECSCGKALRIPDELAGKEGKCPSCHRRFRAPSRSGDERVHFRCACGKSLAAPAGAVGMTRVCPSCRQRVSVPAPVGSVSSFEEKVDLSGVGVDADESPYNAPRAFREGRGLAGSGAGGEHAGKIGAAVNCTNHLGVTAAGRCAGCAEPFCDRCLVDIKGQRYCSSCKVMALEGRDAVIPDVATIPCKEAGQALTLAIIGIFCFGIILAPIALVKASQARRAMAENPRLSGHGKTTAATIIAVLVLILSALAIVIRVSQTV